VFSTGCRSKSHCVLRQPTGTEGVGENTKILGSIAGREGNSYVKPRELAAQSGARAASRSGWQGQESPTSALLLTTCSCPWDSRPPFSNIIHLSRRPTREIIQYRPR